MKPAEYSLIRYVADPARNEPLNIGIVAWDGLDYHLELDHDAVARVVRENPRLHRDSLFQLETSLLTLLSDNKHKERTVVDVIEGQRGYPVLFSEPRHTALNEEATGLADAVQRLLVRTVRPHRRAGGGMDVFDTVERAMRPLVSERRVSRDFVFPHSRTGVHRSVDYFANSERNTALDLVKLNLKRADEIRLRADAEAYKILDIEAANKLAEFVVLVDFSNDPQLAPVNDSARRILRSASPTVRIETDPKSAILSVTPPQTRLR